MKKITRFFLGPERGPLAKIDSKYWNGLRIATIGGLTTFIGMAIVALGLESLGKIIVVIGIIIGVIGMGYHFIMIAVWANKRKE